MDKHIKILYAEDDDSLREVITELLRSEGIDCVPVRDGQEATEKLKTDTFNVVLTDFQMPRMDGADLLFWCRKNNMHIPFIFISANLERLPKEAFALDDCCSSYLNKPVDFDSLLSAINDAITRKHEFECRGKSVDETAANGFVFKGKHSLT